MKKNKTETIKDVFIAILIGACVSFLTTLFDGLADVLRANAPQITAGLSYTAYHVAKYVRV